MDYDTTDLRNAFTEARRREDEKDFHDEMSGRDTYKIARYLSAEQREDRKEHRSTQARRADGMSRLQSLLASSTAYAKIYNDTFDALRDAEAATERAIARATEALEAAQLKVQSTLDRAAKLPDGTRVFKDKRGEVWNEHGQRVSDGDAAGIEWRGNEPAYEQFLEDRESVKDRLTHLEDLQGYRVDTLGRIRGEMMDKDNPKSADELEQFKRDIDTKMPSAARAEISAEREQINPVAQSSLGIEVRPL